MSDETPVNVQEIMSQIERQLWSERDNQDPPWIPDVDDQLRVYLVRLREMAGNLQLEPIVQRDSLPVIGWLVTWWRTQIHQLVLFYVNSLIRQQVAFEQAVTRTIIYLAEHLAEENKRLRLEMEDLRQELGHLRNAGGNQEE
jgi:hypothetical protein